MKLRPVARYPGYQRLLPGSPRGTGANLADGEGFEPPEGVNLLRFSRPPQSAALPSLRRPISWRHENGGASGNRTHVAAVQRRCSPAELWPREKSGAASPMPTAPATMATFLLGFRTNHRGPSPGNDMVGRGRCRSGGSFSLHPRRPSLRGGVKSEIILILVSRAASQPPSVSAPACPNSVGSNPLTAR